MEHGENAKCTSVKPITTINIYTNKTLGVVELTLQTKACGTNR